MPFEHTNDPAMGNLGYARAQLDHYPTPPDVTQALLPFLQLHRGARHIWEPACGNGAMAKVLGANGYAVRATDIRHYGYAEQETEPLDFLKSATAAEMIVTNPPYELAEEFIRQAITLTQDRIGVAALLLRHEYDCASGRNDLFSQMPFARKITLLWRPRWIPDTTTSPRFPYAWFLWDHMWTGGPKLSYAKRP
jgi:hypothetical protein